LHDDVGQSLTALKINLETIKKTGSLEGPSLQNGIDIVAAMLLGLVTLDGSPLTPEKFHLAFLLMAVIPLLGIPGFLKLQPEDGVQVSGHQRRPKKRL